jgi:transposase
MYNIVMVTRRTTFRLYPNQAQEKTLYAWRRLHGYLYNSAAAQEIKALNKEKRRKRSPNRKKKTKASKDWKRAQNKVSQLTRKVARKRDDWMHQVSSNIVSGNSLIATEKLTIKNMTRKAKKVSKRKAQKTGLNRNMLDVGIGMLKSALARRSVKNTPCSMGF